MAAEYVRDVVRGELRFVANSLFSYIKSLEESAIKLSAPSSENYPVSISEKRTSFVKGIDKTRIPPTTGGVLDGYLDEKVPFSDVALALTEVRQLYEKAIAAYGLESPSSEKNTASQ